MKEGSIRVVVIGEYMSERPRKVQVNVCLTNKQLNYIKSLAIMKNSKVSVVIRDIVEEHRLKNK